MLDIGWSEMLVIAAVMIIVVGPKDLPGLLRTIGRTFGQIRRMANEFTGQFNEALREAEFDEINRSVKELEKNNPLKKAGEDLKADLDKSVKDIPKQIDNAGAKPAAGNGSAAGANAAGAAAGAGVGAGAWETNEAGKAAADKATESTVKIVDTPIAPAHSLGSGAYGGPQSSGVSAVQGATPSRSVIEKAEKAIAKPAGDTAAAEAATTSAANSEARRSSVAERAEKAWKTAIGDDSSA